MKQERLKENHEQILSQWQTCVEMANSISQRRDTMNNIFVSLNLGILAAISITWNIKTLFLMIAGIVLCGVWISFINNYKMLNTAKFDVIHKLESKMSMTPFDDEWEILKNNKKYKNETSLERLIPCLFILLYAIAIIVLCINKLL